MKSKGQKRWNRMKGLFIPEITAEMFRNGCLEGIEALMAEGEIYDIEYEAEPRRGRWEVVDYEEPRRYGCSECKRLVWHTENYCPCCGAKMESKQ